LGAVLAMKWATTLAVAALTGLSACGEGSQDSLGFRLYDALFGGDDGAIPMETPGFTAQLIADNPQNFMIVDLPSIGLNQPARIIAQNGEEETWQAQGGPTFAFDRGVLVATRGLIDDLLVFSSAGVREAIAAGGGTITRTLESLDSLDQLSTLTLTCTITFDGSEAVNLGLREVTLRKYSEKCESQALVFENAYWLDGSGAILASRQFISAKLTYLRSNRL